MQLKEVRFSTRNLEPSLNLWMLSQSPSETGSPFGLWVLHHSLPPNAAEPTGSAYLCAVSSTAREVEGTEYPQLGTGPQITRLTFK